MATHIAIITPLNPYPCNTGGKLRIFNLAKALKQAGFRVSMIICDPLFSGDPAPPLQRLCQPVQVVQADTPRFSLFQRLLLSAQATPIPTYKRMQAAIHQKINEWKPDYVQLEWTFACAQVDFAGLRKQRTGIVLDGGAVHHLSYQRRSALARNSLARWLWSRRSRRLKRYETRLLSAVDVVTAVSSPEADLLYQMNPSVKIIYVPNGVDDNILEKETTRFQERENNLFFCGDFSYEPNLDAIRYYLDYIAPRRRDQIPPLKLIVAGANLPADIIARAATKDGGVEWLGHVADIHHCFERYAIMINPMRLGGGTRLKILEALAHGMACVSTSIGAEGLNLQDQQHVLFADTPELFAAAISRLSNDRSFSENLGRQARRHVQQQFAWSRCAANLVQYYRTGSIGRA